ncbi:high-affinity choline transporter 1-like [Schistocerca piceifrons]|uniref:high-affinity choline transporter 1-like n=1 Tax=Schistocerca piceifrons TaxID=274613 RepID=UPI001F5FDF34|nr:high-affinity choline transporter 1-like [Schistocerca piceifrons]
MAVFVAGIAGILVFYLLVLAVGIWAGSRRKGDGDDDFILAGRSIGLYIGLITFIATYVGGGYINATTEAMFDTGLAWCQVPFGYGLSLILGALLFVRPMRAAQYVTMLDPLQQRFGSRVGGLLYIPAVCGDLFWVGAILNALGSSLEVILGLDRVTSVTVSAVFAAAYTMVGGLLSVTYTDVLQLIFIVFGLVLSAPFAYSHPAVDHSAVASADWLGTLKQEDIGEWSDLLLMMIFGGLSWQGYFQRVLSVKTTCAAQALSLGSVVGCMLLAIPPAFIGIIARATDWQAVEDVARNITSADKELVLPLVLRYLTPSWVAFFGLGAISASIMASADSSILASSSMFSRNIYKLVLRTQASEREMVWVLRVSVVVITAIAALIGLTAGSIYYLSVLCSDLVYVVLFPQLFLAVHCPRLVNQHGSVAAFVVGIVLRLLCGENGLGLPAALHLPGYEAETGRQRFPFRTLTMLAAAATLLVVSAVAARLRRPSIGAVCRHVALRRFQFWKNSFVTHRRRKARM